MWVGCCVIEKARQRNTDDTVRNKMRNSAAHNEDMAANGKVI